MHRMRVVFPAPFGRPVGDLLASAQHDDPPRQIHQRPHDVLDHQERDALAPEPPDQRHGALGLRRVEPGHQLVEQQEPRRGGERARQLEALEVDQRELRRQAVRLALQAHECEQTLGLPHPRARVAAGAAVETPHEHVVESGEPGERSSALERARDTLGAHAVRREAGDVAIVEADRAGVRLEGPRDQVEERRLARPVGAHDPDQLAVLDGEADLADRAHPAERLRDPFHLQEGQRPSPRSVTACRTAAPDRRAGRWRRPWARPAPAGR